MHARVGVRLPRAEVKNKATDRQNAERLENVGRQTQAERSAGHCLRGLLPVGRCLSGLLPRFRGSPWSPWWYIGESRYAKSASTRRPRTCHYGYLKARLRQVCKLTKIINDSGPLALYLTLPFSFLFFSPVE